VSGSPAPSQDSGSTIRLIAGSTLCILSIAGALYGFVSLIQVLDAGGYGSSAMRQQLVVLGVAGAGLAGGIATLIWVVAMRYEKK
jgi:hypothetical protein